IGTGPIDDPSIKPLIPDPQQAAINFYRQTNVYPINHMVVVKNSVLEQYPWVASALFDAFDRAKKEYLQKLNKGENLTQQDEAMLKTRQIVGPDPVPYGIAANRPTISTMIRYNVQQGIIPSQYDVEE